MKHTLRDDSLPHQIRIGVTTDGMLKVGCSCWCPEFLKAETISGEEAMEAWRKHVEAERFAEAGRDCRPDTEA